MLYLWAMKFPTTQKFQVIKILNQWSKVFELLWYCILIHLIMITGANTIHSWWTQRIALNIHHQKIYYII